MLHSQQYTIAVVKRWRIAHRLFFWLALNIALISAFSPHRWRCKDFFKEISSRSDKLISVAFFPRPGINPTAAIPLFIGTTWDTGDWNSTMVKKRKEKKEKEDKTNRKNFALAEVWAHNLCVQSWVFYPLDLGAQPGYCRVSYGKQRSFVSEHGL